MTKPKSKVRGAKAVKLQELKGFIIADNDGHLFYATFRHEKSSCLAKAQAETGMGWNELKKDGFRCIPVTIQPLKTRGARV